MKFGIFSDLHLDCYLPEYVEPLIDSIIEQAMLHNVDVLVNAGDVCDNYNSDIAKRFYERMLGSDISYVSVYGNHDFYHSDQWETSPWIFRTNGLKIATAVLWTDCHNEPRSEHWFIRNMRDAYEIKGFSIAKMKYLHVMHREAIFDAKPDIVVTHNPPSMLSTGPYFRDAPVYTNQAFMPELGNRILDSGIKLWICGHVHHEHEYMIGDTKIVCNPHGYPKERRRFGPYQLKIVEV